MAQNRNAFDQLPTNVMRDEQLLALVRQTRPTDPPAAAPAAESNSAPTALYRTIDVQFVERERMNAVRPAPPQPEPATTAPAAIGAARPATVARATHGLPALRLVLLLLLASCLAYLTL